MLVKKQLKQMLYFLNAAGPARVLTLGISRISHETFRKNKKKKKNFDFFFEPNLRKRI